MTKHYVLQSIKPYVVSKQNHFPSESIEPSMIADQYAFNFKYRSGIDGNNPEVHSRSENKFNKLIFTFGKQLKELMFTFLTDKPASQLNSNERYLELSVMSYGFVLQHRICEGRQNRTFKLDEAKSIDINCFDKYGLATNLGTATDKPEDFPAMMNFVVGDRRKYIVITPLPDSNQEWPIRLIGQPLQSIDDTDDESDKEAELKAQLEVLEEQLKAATTKPETLCVLEKRYPGITFHDTQFKMIQFHGEWVFKIPPKSNPEGMIKLISLTTDSISDVTDFHLAALRELIKKENTL